MYSPGCCRVLKGHVFKGWISFKFLKILVRLFESAQECTTSSLQWRMDNFILSIPGLLGSPHLAQFFTLSFLPKL